MVPLGVIRGTPKRIEPADRSPTQMELHYVDHRVEVVRTPAELKRFGDVWEDLARQAADRNFFYEPISLLPAIDAFGADRDLCFVFVFETTAASGGASAIGFFPFEVKTSFRGLPLKHLALWRHPQLYLATPLVRETGATLAWRALLRWAATEGALIEMPLMLAEGVTYHSLRKAMQREGSTAARVDQFDRAVLMRYNMTSDTYCELASSPGARREWRRQKRRLGELGRLEVRAIQPEDNAETWLDWFLDLEAKGWKRAAGTALASGPAEESYFRAVCASAHKARILHMLGYFLDGVPVAMQCNIIMDRAAFALKVAFDERFRKYSPGALLELENIADMYRRDGFVWMDSCTMRRHPLMHRIWRDRRTIEHLLVAPAHGWGRLVIKIFPYLQQAKRRLKLGRKPQAWSQ